MRLSPFQVDTRVPTSLPCVADTAPPAPCATAAAQPLRLRHVDSLRAIAAGLVVWTHLAPGLLPVSGHDPAWLAFLHRLPPLLAMGRLGVDIFFIISGFVICRSFGGPPEGSARRFLIRRFCRLYPVFWVSVALAVCMEWLDGHPPTLSLIAANATMTPAAFGQSALVGLYWTLNIELIFYGLCLLLHWLGRLDGRGVLVGCVLVFAAARRASHLVGKLTGGDVSVSEECDVWLVSLALMFWGALFRSVYEETGGFRRAHWWHAGSWLLLLVTFAMLDVHNPRLKTMFLRHPVEQWGESLVTVNSLVFFTLWVGVLRVETRLLTFVGVVSYSLYLFHPFVSEWFVRGLRLLDVHLPLWALLAVGGACSVALAALLYRWVERPAITLGRRWAGLDGSRPRPATRPSH